MVLLYNLIHKIYVSLFNRSKKAITPDYFFTTKFGVELLVIGLITLGVGGLITLAGAVSEIILYIGYGFLTAFMIYRGLLKIIVF